MLLVLPISLYYVDLSEFEHSLFFTFGGDKYIRDMIWFLLALYLFFLFILVLGFSMLLFMLIFVFDFLVFFVRMCF